MQNLGAIRRPLRNNCLSSLIVDCQDENCDIRPSGELQSTLGSLHKQLEIATLKWFGHVVRAECKEVWQTPSCRVKLSGKDHEEGQQDSEWLDDVKEWAELE